MEHVDLTLHYLAAVLRGSQVPADHLPDLRQDQRRLVETQSGEERHALVNVETDRITNSVNTLAKEILEWRLEWLEKGHIHRRGAETERNKTEVKI